MVFWLKDFPLPPSVNKSLMPVAGKLRFNAKGKPYRIGRMVKTHSARCFVNDAMVWAAQRHTGVAKMKNEILKCKQDVEKTGEKFALHIECYFVFETEHMTLADVDNRLKPCLDALKKILGIDDRYFFSSFCEKVTTASKDLECTMIRISQQKPRTKTSIQEKMQKEVSTADS